MPAIFNFSLGEAAPRKPKTPLGATMKAAVERAVPRKKWRRVSPVLFAVALVVIRRECN
jgi:hypothetical protein